MSDKIEVRALENLDGLSKWKTMFMNKELYKQFFIWRVELVSEKKEVKNKSNKAMKKQNTK